MIFIVSYHYGGKVRVEAGSQREAVRMVEKAMEGERSGANIYVTAEPLDGIPVFGEQPDEHDPPTS